MGTPQGELQIDRFYLKTPYEFDLFESLVIEVVKEQWVQVERASGFRTYGRPGEPATGGFSASNGLRGERRTFWTTIRNTQVAKCGNCQELLTLVNEEFYAVDGLTSRATWRHHNPNFPESLGPLECALPVVQLQAKFPGTS